MFLFKRSLIQLRIVSHSVLSQSSRTCAFPRLRRFMLMFLRVSLPCASLSFLDTTTDCFALCALTILKNMRIPAPSALHAYVLACPKSPCLNVQARLSMGFCPLLYQADNGTRTRDLRITNATHYHLCYISITFCKASLIYHLNIYMSISNFLFLLYSICLDLFYVM